MPLHFTLEQKWTLFLNNIIKNNLNFKVNVIAVHDKDVIFKADIGTIQYLRHLLANPEDLKSGVFYLNNNNQTLDFDNDLSSHHKSDPAYYNYAPIELLEQLFSPQYILNEEDGIGLKGRCSLQEFKYDPITSVATLHLEGTKNTIARDTAKFNMLASSLPSSQTASAILNHEVEPIDQELSEEESTDLFSILQITVNDPPKSADIIYNYGALLQKLQAIDKISTPDHPPIIASCNVKRIEGWTLDKDIIINYLAPMFNNVVFTPELESNTIRPIIFFLKKVISQPHSLHALFDTSGSMTDGFENYLQKYLIVLNKFIDTVKQDWQITVVRFDNVINSRTFNSNSHDFNDISSYVQTFEPGGTTRLHEALYQSLQYYKNNSMQDLLSTLIVFTDGCDSLIQSTPSIEQVSSLAKEVAQQNHNFALYSMGLGVAYNQQFFTEIAQDGGFTHINLNTTNDITDLIQYMESCANSRIRVLVLNTNGEEYMERVPQDGNPHVANNTISIGASIVINGQEYTVSDITSNDEYTLVGVSDV